MLPEYTDFSPDWEGERCFLLGGGPSLAGFDAERLRGHGRVIAINNSYLLCPWCDLLYFCDSRWWGWHWQNMEPFAGRIVTPALIRDPKVRRVQMSNMNGLDLRRDRVCGMDSGYQAINLAFHLGAKELVLMGYDYSLSEGRTNWHAGHPDGITPEQKERSLKQDLLPAYMQLVKPLEREGVSVVSIGESPVTWVTGWPAVSLNDILPSCELMEARTHEQLAASFKAYFRPCADLEERDEAE